MAEKTTVCRAVTFPFMPHDGMEWRTLDPLLRECWSRSTHLANWAMCELALADRLTVDRGAEKLGPLPEFDLYKIGFTSKAGCRPVYPWRDKWAGAAKSASTIFRAVRRKYNDMRLDVVWRGSCSLPSYRYPYPFPVHNQDWLARYGKDKILLVDVTLPGGRVTLRLRGGPEMRRQEAGFRQIVGGAKRGELALLKKGKHPMIKLVAHFPINTTEEATKTMLVRTDPNALWVAEIEGTHPRVWNQDHVRHWILTHKAWLQRVSEDTKREKRVPRKMRGHMDHARDDRCRKQNDRLATFCHQMTAQLVQFAVRQKVGTLIYDDQVKTYLDPFPWHRLKTFLRYKLEEKGITFLGRDESPGETERESDDPTIIE